MQPECPFGSICVGTSSEAPAQAGVCEPLSSTVGAACDPLLDRAPTCDRRLGLSCELGSCAALAYAAPLACGCGTSSTSQSVACTSGSACVSGCCSKTAGDGEACNIALGPFCVQPARCLLGPGGGVTGTCRVPDPCD
jgi:hypothetical protein